MSSIKGRPIYKVSMAYQDGYKCIGSLVVSGPQARKKAKIMGEIFWQRVDKKSFSRRRPNIWGGMLVTVA